MENLARAFPEKSLEERKKIARQFYSHFTDTFIESLKLLSISNEELDKRCTGNIALVNELAANGRNIQFHCGHQMNWEYISRSFARRMTIPWVGIYRRIANKIFDKIFYNLRSRDRAVLISTREFKTRMHEIYKKQYSILLIADQNPWDLNNCYWLNYFNKATPFVIGPDKGAVIRGTAVVFLSFKKVRRGYYQFETKVITENAATMKRGELTRMYRDFLESEIKQNPANYLWSHRRWKHNFDASNKSFMKNWIDEKAPPLN